MTLGEVIRRKRKAAGLTQGELAGMARLPTSFVCRVERGYGEDPGIFRMARIARALGVTLDWLLAAVEKGPHNNSDEAARSRPAALRLVA